MTFSKAEKNLNIKPVSDKDFDEAIRTITSIKLTREERDAKLIETGDLEHEAA